MLSSHHYESMILMVAILLLGLNFTYKLSTLVKLYSRPNHDITNGQYSSLNVYASSLLSLQVGYGT